MKVAIDEDEVEEVLKQDFKRTRNEQILTHGTEATNQMSTKPTPHQDDRAAFAYIDEKFSTIKVESNPSIGDRENI